MKKAISFLILILLCVAITPGAGTEPGKIVFDDKNLESSLSKIIGKPVGKIEKADLEKLTKLDLSKKKISSLKGIEHCRNLTQLILSVNLVKDISPLANLTKLTELKLYNNKIEDIYPLAKLTNLERLYLGFNKGIKDFSKLE